MQILCLSFLLAEMDTCMAECGLINKDLQVANFTKLERPQREAYEGLMTVGTAAPLSIPPGHTMFHRLRRVKPNNFREGTYIIFASEPPHTLRHSRKPYAHI